MSNEQASTKAVISLVSGILAFVLCPCIGSVVAIIAGWGEKSGVGRAGFILGWISLGLLVIVALIYAVFIGGAVALQR